MVHCGRMNYKIHLSDMGAKISATYSSFFSEDHQYRQTKHV
jgi:hypothetical protein